MAGFLYYVPKSLYSGSLTLERIRELGLAYAFDADGPMIIRNDIGPDKLGGMICSPVTIDQMGFYADRQVWRKIVGNPHGVYVGMYTNEHRPKPADLKRVRQLPGGVEHKLEDDNRWLFPIVRRWKEEGSEVRWQNSLPARFTLNDEGMWVTGGTLPRYERLWQLAMQYQDHVFDNNPDESAKAIVLDTDFVSDLFVESLKANYRLSHTEVDMLGIYCSESFQSCVDTLFDNTTLEKLLEKKSLQPSGGLSS